MVTEEEAETAGETSGVSKTRTAMARVSKVSGTTMLSVSKVAGGGNTWVVTSEAVDDAGVGGCHGLKLGERERVAGWQENPDGKSSGVGGSEGGREAFRVTETQGGISREWEGESSRQGASTPPEWKS